MKKMLTENLWLKLISVVLASILWVLILYTYDPTATADFNLNVNVINGDTITSLGKVYEVIEGSSVTIRVKANSSLVKTLRTSDFEATADVSKLSPTSHANIDVVCTRANNIDIRLIGKVKFLEVKLEDMITKEFPVTVEKRGEAEEGFFIGNAIPKPNFITVSGGKSSVNKIKSVKVKVDAENSTKSFVTMSSPKAYDIDGTEITTGSLSFSVASIHVALNIFRTKNIPISIKTIGEPYSGYGVESINFEPKMIVVAGDDEKLKKISKVVLPVEVDGEITNVESSIRMIDYIPDGIYLVDADTVVNVNTNIVRFVTKDILLPYPNIKLLNQSEDFVYELLSQDPLKITVKGLKADVDNVLPETLEAELDFNEIVEAGEQTVQLNIKEIKGITLPASVPVNFMVREKEEPSEEPTEEVPEGETVPEKTDPNNSTEGNEDAASQEKNPQ